MKKMFGKISFSIYIGVFMFFGFMGETNAQQSSPKDLYIVAKKMEFCLWNEGEKSFTKDCETSDVEALFMFNKKRTTFFVQFDGKGGTTYDILSSEYEKKYDATFYDIQNGDKLYLLIVDIDDELLKLMPKSGKDAGNYLMMFPVTEVYNKD